MQNIIPNMLADNSIWVFSIVIIFVVVSISNLIIVLCVCEAFIFYKRYLYSPFSESIVEFEISKKKLNISHIHLSPISNTSSLIFNTEQMNVAILYGNESSCSLQIIWNTSYKWNGWRWRKKKQPIGCIGRVIL